MDLYTTKTGRHDFPRYLSPNSVARILDVPPDTVRNLVRRGDLPGRHVGRLIRIAESDLRVWLARVER
jgi:excisionase family DNA binding protein